MFENNKYHDSDKICLNLEKEPPHICGDERDLVKTCDKCALFLFDNIMNTDNEKINPWIIDTHEISHTYSNSYWKNDLSILKLLSSISELSPYHFQQYGEFYDKRLVTITPERIDDIISMLDIDIIDGHETLLFMEYFQKNIDQKIFIFEC